MRERNETCMALADVRNFVPIVDLVTRTSWQEASCSMCGWRAKTNFSRTTAVASSLRMLLVLREDVRYPRSYSNTLIVTRWTKRSNIYVHLHFWKLSHCYTIDERVCVHYNTTREFWFEKLFSFSSYLSLYLGYSKLKLALGGFATVPKSSVPGAAGRARKLAFRPWNISARSATKIIFDLFQNLRNCQATHMYIDLADL